MRRPGRTRAVLAALLAGTTAAGPLAGGAIGAKHQPFPAHLLVYAQEWSLWLSSSSLPAGAVDVELWNRGQDAHDLRVRRLDARGQMTGQVLGGVRKTPSGQISHGVWHLRAGRYEIYCSLPGHLELGMHAVITVRRS